MISLNQWLNDISSLRSFSYSISVMAEMYLLTFCITVNSIMGWKYISDENYCHALSVYWETMVFIDRPTYGIQYWHLKKMVRKSKKQKQNKTTPPPKTFGSSCFCSGFWSKHLCRVQPKNIPSKFGFNMSLRWLNHYNLK